MYMPVDIRWFFILALSSWLWMVLGFVWTGVRGKQPNHAVIFAPILFSRYHWSAGHNCLLSHRKAARVKDWMRTASYLTFGAVIAAFTPDLKSMLVIIFAWAGVLLVEGMTE